MTRPKTLILAEDCNPEWPSLPVVGYKYARSIGKYCDVTVVTHIRNKENIEKRNKEGVQFEYIDNEYIASPMYKLAKVLRGGTEVAWSTNMIMAYLPYVEFERQVLKRFRSDLRNGAFDVVHRVTPMSPTLPSYIAGRVPQPFVIGPLNGNLAWPAAYRTEQRREREGLRKLRDLYRYLPFARSTYRDAACVFAAFQHTIDDIDAADPAHVVPFPEIGFDREMFYPDREKAPYAGDRPYRFLFAGRLVPYKVPEAAVRAFAESEALRPHVLHVVGEGPEGDRLKKIVADAGAGDRILFEGRKSQAEVAAFMRRCDAFVFPSVRELGAGVVIEAMASGMVCLVTDYGAPGDLAANGRGVRVPLQPMDGLVRGYRAAMEACVVYPQKHAALAVKALAYATTFYDWDAKAAYTRRIYDALLAGKPLTAFTDYR
jgi:glycosyltransferase involved in cell wall biosynthesis